MGLATTFFLTSPRLGFRSWRDDDVELAERLWGDPEVTRWIGGPMTKGEVAARLATEMATERAHGVQYWPIFLLEGGDHVGACGLRPKPRACGPYRLDEGIYELGFHIRRAHWGRGYASEAARAVIAHAFTTLDAKALFAGHNPHNTDSARVLEKLGFTYTHDELYPPTGLEHPSYLRTRDDG